MCIRDRVNTLGFPPSLLGTFQRVTLSRLIPWTCFIFVWVLVFSLLLLVLSITFFSFLVLFSFVFRGSLLLLFPFVGSITWVRSCRRLSSHSFYILFKLIILFNMKYYFRFNIILFIPGIGLAYLCCNNIYISVSYTHLDVYKRQ